MTGIGEPKTTDLIELRSLCSEKQSKEVDSRAVGKRLAVLVPMASKRILKELKDLQKDPPTSCSAGNIPRSLVRCCPIAEFWTYPVMGEICPLGAAPLEFCCVSIHKAEFRTGYGSRR